MFRLERLNTIPCVRLWLKLVLATSISVSAQAEIFWQDASAGPLAETNQKMPSTKFPSEFRMVNFNLDSLGTALLKKQPGSVDPVIITFPEPDGGVRAFIIQRSDILPSALSARFPSVSAFKGFAVDDPTVSVRFEVTADGVSAQVLEPGNRWMIDPRPTVGQGMAISYYTKNLKKSSSQRYCEVGSQLTDPRDEVLALKTADVMGSSVSKSSGEILRTYRLAIATTGEYGQYHGGQIASVLSAVVTTVNRVVGILEQEMSISLELVESNDQILFTSPTTDPFTGNNNASVLIEESQTQIDAIIGTANYDIGHTLSTGAGGLAALGSVCDGSSKARGVTGSGQPQGDFFDVDFVAHELGHQFGGNHTFNGASGSCSGANRNYFTAYEPGSGSTIQAYPSLCGADDFQNMVDPIYHSESFSEMYGFVSDGLDSSCGLSEVTNNTAPIVDAGLDYSVPRGTPLVLSGTAVDLEQSALTFLWEQRDLGQQAALSAPDDGEIPLFRVLTPSLNPERYLPGLASVVSGNYADEEKIPQVAREMDFRLTARDAAGGVGSDDTVLSVVASAGPFYLTSPNGGDDVGESKTILWDVARTDLPPISASEVEFFLSTDGGLSFNTSLGTAVNDGSATLTFPPGIETTSARVMVKAVGNVFYDVSDADFDLNSDRPVPPAPIQATVSTSNSGAVVEFLPGATNGLTVTSYEASCSAPSTSEDFAYAVESGQPFNENLPISSTLLVDEELTISGGGLSVPVDIAHTYRGDVVLNLVSPLGSSITLKTNLGSDSGANVVGIYPDTLAPEESLDQFSGESSFGTWILEVSDAYTDDTGILNSWGLNFSIVTPGETITASEGESPIVLSNMTNGVTYTCQITAYAGTDQSEVVELGEVTPSSVITYTVTPSAGEGGTISPSSPQTVTDGATVAFELTASSGYALESIGGTCGGALSGSTFTTNAVTSNCSVSAVFAELAPVTYTVTPSAGEGGTISPSSPQTVTDGATVAFELTASSGYALESIGGTCGGALSGSTFTTNAVTQDCLLLIKFYDNSQGLPPWLIFLMSQGAEADIGDSQ